MRLKSVKNSKIVFILTLTILVNLFSSQISSAATLFSTISSTCTGYGMSANSLRTVIPFYAPSGATLTGFDLKFSSSTDASNMSVKVYSTNPTLSSPTLIGSFVYSSISGTTVSYSGNLSLPSAATYWLYFQSSVYNLPCYAMSPVTTGSTSGWISGGKTYESFNSGSSWTQRGDNLSFLFSLNGTGLIADATAPTFTSSSTFSTAENIAPSATAATIKISESATVTISSGADASLFNIYFSDSVTALVKFKSSPNYEAPTDVGANNVYEITLTATDTAANAGTQSISITVTDVLDTSSFNSFALAGSATSATFRATIQINASVTVASKVTFKAANIVIPGCKSKLATGSGSTFTVSCSWKPSKRGGVTLTATSVPTNVTISGATAAPINVSVVNRSGPR